MNDFLTSLVGASRVYFKSESSTVGPGNSLVTGLKQQWNFLQAFKAVVVENVIPGLNGMEIRFNVGSFFE